MLVETEIRFLKTFLPPADPSGRFRYKMINYGYGLLCLTLLMGVVFSLLFFLFRWGGLKIAHTDLSPFLLKRE